MERKNFLRSLIIGAASAPVLLDACKKESGSTADSTTAVTNTGSTASSASGSCAVAPSETEGPFPTKTPASYVRSDITDGRTGYKLTIKLTINSSSSCSALANTLVDIWHCDAEGNYSEYGGSSMQSTNYTTVHFLRGRQTTDANGLVTFTSIFPGWYSGRATHIHVHVHNTAGTSLKVTQISFPEGTGTALVLVNGYAKGLSGYTYNKSDNVFSDDTAGVEIATVSGSMAAGFELTKIITV
jgi:protocatechuate 3,4-dioxygenase beta subunit